MFLLCYRVTCSYVLGRGLCVITPGGLLFNCSFVFFCMTYICLLIFIFFVLFLRGRGFACQLPVLDFCFRSCVIFHSRYFSGYALVVGCFLNDLFFVCCWTRS